MSNALTQYIGLFEQNRETVCANSAGKLNTLRDEALAQLRDAHVFTRLRSQYFACQYPG